MPVPPKPSGRGKTTPYQAPVLKVYGGMAQLTAAGTGADLETFCFNDPSQSGGMKAGNMNKTVRC
jgi:hypothetical protein